MSVIPNPYDDPAAWGTVLIGGAPLPGELTLLEMPDREYEWAVQMGLGLGGAATIFRTTKLIETIGIELWFPDADAFAAGEEFMRVLVGPGWPQKIKVKPKAYKMSHPMAQWVGVTSVHCKAFGAPKDVSGKLNYRLRVTLQEDSPRIVIPTGPAEPAKIDGPPKPQDALEAALVGALAEFNKP